MLNFYGTKINVYFILLLLFVLPSVLSAQDPQKTQGSMVNLLEKTINQYPGDVIYLDFWASWCVPCRKSFPWMNKMVHKYEKQGLRVISINLDKSKDLAQEFLIKNPANFIVLYDPEGELPRAFNIKGMPTSILIDSKGEVSKVHTGFYESKTMLYQAEIKTLLDSK